MAAEAGLPVADKPDSQEICFIPDDNYRAFLADRTSPQPGDYVDLEGAVLGRHPGVQFFTIGQRRGLGLDGGSGEPRYVVKIDPSSNRVTLGGQDDLYRSRMWASRINFPSGMADGESRHVTAKIRYKASESPATVTVRDGYAEVLFNAPQRAVTPGQAVVFYEDDELVGGGIIEVERPVAA